MQTLPCDKETYIAYSRELVNAIGAKKLCALGQFTPQALTGWKNRGIPIYWLLVLKARYPRQYKQAFRING